MVSKFERTSIGCCESCGTPISTRRVPFAHYICVDCLAAETARMPSEQTRTPHHHPTSQERASGVVMPLVGVGRGELEDYADFVI